ncbi:MAG: glycoside hydrolase family 5 protein [Melioribacteraceae bacterium]|nr:glycoside hydrolase family 5 protein [Melioribacteraceae bacterium]MCF8264591.1 glycoside hydrolase family 5 protein [Melioribacteraceae bacterium]MCF8432686.1 glycoside hydrolase family 5 protein [Melioribacteraceae bacterium]
MKSILSILVALILFSAHVSCEDSPSSAEEPEVSNAETIVGLYGALAVSGKNIVNQSGEIVELRGMSLFWSQWGGNYYTRETVKWLRDDWNCTIVRAAIGVEGGGYLENKTAELQKLYTVIDACIEFGIYVIVDWHDHHGESHLSEAKEFFGTISQKYGAQPNIIYEIYNEPLNVSWVNVLKPYSEAVITEIRKNDPDNLIIVGTPNWSQDVESVIGNRLEDPNVLYSFHFYSSTHTDALRNKARLAFAANIPLFVSEWGLSEASGTGEIKITESNEWVEFLEENRLSWCNWSIINKDETSASLKPSTDSVSEWAVEELSQSGNMIRDYLILKNGPVFENLKN